VGEVISIREAYRARRRRQTSALNASCRILIAEGIETWRRRYARATEYERDVCGQRIRSLAELLTYAERLP